MTEQNSFGKNPYSLSTPRHARATDLWLGDLALVMTSLFAFSTKEQAARFGDSVGPCKGFSPVSRTFGGPEEAF